MHRYLRAIGFSNKNRKEIQELVLDCIRRAERRGYTLVDDETMAAEFSREYADGMGITACGNFDEDDKFHLDYYFPYLDGTGVTSYEDISVEKHASEDSFAGVCDDIKVGISIIFYLKNKIPYIKAQSTGKLPIKGTSVTFSGLSVKGSILIPINKADEKSATQNDNTDRAKLLAAAKNGDEEAIETLTLEDMDTYNTISKRIKNEDVYSIVDTSFMPYGVECDQYAIIGDIVAFQFKPSNSASSYGSYYTGMDIYMANVSESVFTGSFIYPDSNHQFVQVMANGNCNYTTDDWQTITLDTSFTWDGHSNVLFAVNRSHGSYSCSATYEAHNATGSKLVYAYNDNNPYNINNASADNTSSQIGDLRLISCGASGCRQPVVTSVTKDYHSATVTWTGEGNNYEVNIKESTATDWPATDIAVTGNSYTFNGLMPATNYTFRVRQDCTADSLDYSEWVIGGVLTDSLPCLTPDSLHATAVTNATATLDWNVNGNENVWDIHVWYGSFDSIYRTILRPATVSGFTAGITYNAAIRAVCGINLLEGDWSDTVQFTTAVCPDITGLTTSNVTTNSVTLNWSSNPMALRWNIEYGPTGFTQGQGTTAVSNTNSYVVTGLSDGITYDFYVKAVCGDDWTSENWVGTSATTQEGTIPCDAPTTSENWVGTSATTQEGTIPCDAPTGVSTAVADNSVTVNWTAGTGNISFELEYGPRGFSHGAGSTTTATSSPAVIANLDYETQYDIYVRAVCEQNIFSPWSTVSTFTTGERPSEDCDPVQNLTVTNVTETSADVTWQPGPTGDHWQVVLTDGAGSTISDDVTAERQATFSNLTPGTNYTVKVRTDCGDGNYSAYVTANFRTLGGEGIEDVDGISCRIFPNPATSSTTISVTHQQHHHQCDRCERNSPHRSGRHERPHGSHRDA